MKKLTPERWLYHARKQLYYFTVLDKLRRKKNYGTFLFGSQLTFSTSDSFRGVLSYYEIEFGRKFYIKNLIKVFDENKIKLPKEIRAAGDIDKYEKISLGFPYPDMTEQDLKDSHALAKEVLKWAKEIIKDKPRIKKADIKQRRISLKHKHAV